MQLNALRQNGLTFVETLIMLVFLGTLAAIVATFFSWLKQDDAGTGKGPAPLARHFISEAFGIKPSDVAVYVKFASGDQDATVRAEAGMLSCLIEASAADDERSPRFGWLVTSMQCGQSMCAEGAASAGPDGKPVTCSKGDILSPATIEERTNQAEKCFPESDTECVGIDLEAIQKAAQNGEFKASAVNAK